MLISLRHSGLTFPREEPPLKHSTISAGRPRFMYDNVLYHI